MSTWTIDPDHSVAAFAVGHMMVNLVRGQFNQVSGVIRFDPPDLCSLSVEATIEAASLITGVPKRDEHLKSADFLDVARYPQIIFRSVSTEGLSVNGFLLNGLLTIHGVTHTVGLEAEYFGPATSPDGDVTLGFHARTRLNREIFGLAWNVEMANQGFMVGKELYLDLHIEGDRVA